MGTITVDSNNYEVYGDLAAATLYIAGLMTAGAVAWRAKTTNEKSRALLNARLLLDQQAWEGAKTSGAQTLQWPRTGADYADGTPVGTSVIPTEIDQAEYELACFLSADPSVYSADSTGTNVKRLKAGPLEVENFVPTIRTGSILPRNVMNLVGQFLLSSDGPRAGVVSGSDSDSDFTDCDTYSRFGPF